MALLGQLLFWMLGFAVLRLPLLPLSSMILLDAGPRFLGK